MDRNCLHCGKQNHVPLSRLADAAKCGACKSALPAYDAPLEVGEYELDEILRGAHIPVLVDFWAAWCGPCRMSAPEVERVARELAGRAIVLKVDTEQHPSLANRYGVRGIPNFAVLLEGEVVRQEAGVVPAAEMRRWLEEAAGSPESHA